MAEAVAAEASRAKSALAALRESRGGVSAEMKAWLKDQQDVRKKLRAALAAGARTVPDLAGECGVDSGRVLWHLMAMRRYGEVAEAGERDRYVLYALKKG
ncbi:MAG TPA: hypothetical protein VMT70_02120 [Vicinamibacteria bacterium]|nr:hypothetical protein [Vicinamibacteria bacterium]